MIPPLKLLSYPVECFLDEGVRGEQIVYKSIQINAKTKSVTYTEAVVKEILDREKDGVNKLETPEAVISHKKPEVVVETFPLRPVSKTIHDMDGEDSKLNGVSGTLEEKASQHEEIIFTKSSSNLINGKVEENLPPLESSDFSTTAEATTPNGNIIQDVEAKDSLPEGTKASDSPKQVSSEGDNGS